MIESHKRIPNECRRKELIKKDNLGYTLVILKSSFIPVIRHSLSSFEFVFLLTIFKCVLPPVPLLLTMVSQCPVIWTL